nr:hypothetical protein [Sphingosinicella sp. BN140058]
MDEEAGTIGQAGEIYGVRSGLAKYDIGPPSVFPGEPVFPRTDNQVVEAIAVHIPRTCCFGDVTIKRRVKSKPTGTKV